MTATGQLSDPVRTRVLSIVSAALTVLADDEVPRSLRPFIRFTPTRRVRAAGGAIAAALEDNEEFRERVAAAVQDDPLAAAVAQGAVPPAADPVQAAALAYLLRPEGWPELVQRLAAVADAQARDSAHEAASEQVRRLTGQLEAARAELREQTRRAREEQARVAAEADGLRRQLREQSQTVRQAQQTATQAAAELAEERERSAAAQSRLEAELRRLRQRVREAEAAAESARRATREGRAADDLRRWLLLDTLINAAQGLRRELALTPPTDRPADAVAATAEQGADVAAGGTADERRLDQLLALPQAHLVVDGYNVTKSGYGDLPLEAQRTRLVSGLGPLVAQTGAEVTVVFDGADRLPVAPVAPRGVRVLFSARGEIADDLIRRLVDAEPEGRVLAVVSSDREVADAVRRAGAYPFPAEALLARLGRG